MTQATLYVVATPIGNLDDLSPRARRILQEVDLIAAEDTRHSRRLLSHFSIDTPLVAVHEHNEEAAVNELIGRLTNGESIALICDAGTPLVNDPGYRLLQAAHANVVCVSPVPGPCAAVAALSVAGLPTDRFAFEGFLPAKSSARRARLDGLRDEQRTLIFYESVHRFRDTLADMSSAFGGARRAFVGRELTKLHEQCHAAPLDELQRLVDSGDMVLRGEFVIVVDGAARRSPETKKIDEDQLLAALCEVLPGKQAVDIVARVGGGRRNEIYQRMLALKAKN
ncbi:MAG: 16S rRNA (cytidine(1402)-2'-O)-methyltransferase [Gammaproteobacteria bacterium]|nr:16S rRNA (cytidine(1402)-2'-O)-methyltransferase [Gammaproteobacteria bacterium]